MTAVTEQFIRRMWAEGVPRRMIAQYLGVSKSTVALRAKELGLPKRTAWRPRNSSTQPIANSKT